MKHFACSFCITLGIFTAATGATPAFVYVQKATWIATIKAEIKAEIEKAQKKAQEEEQEEMQKQLKQLKLLKRFFGGG